MTRLSKVPRELLERYWLAMNTQNEPGVRILAAHDIRAALAPAPVLRTRTEVDAEIVEWARDLYEYNRCIPAVLPLDGQMRLKALCTEETSPEPGPIIDAELPAPADGQRMTEATKLLERAKRFIDTQPHDYGVGLHNDIRQWLIGGEDVRDERRAQEQGVGLQKPSWCATPDKCRARMAIGRMRCVCEPAQEQGEPQVRQVLRFCQYPDCDNQPDSKRGYCSMHAELFPDTAPPTELERQLTEQKAMSKGVIEGLHTDLSRLRTALANMTAGRDAQRDAADAHYDDLQKVRTALVEIRSAQLDCMSSTDSFRTGTLLQAIDAALAKAGF